MWVKIYDKKDGSDTAYVHEDGYVMFDKHDCEYESQEAATKALEADGFEYVGCDDLD